MRVDKYARIIVKRSILSGVTATIPPYRVGGDDHTLLPAWSTSDIYIGELFLNEIDEKIWIRSNQTNIRRLLTDLDLLSGGTGGATSLDELSDVILNSPINNDVLIYNGSFWVNSAFTFTVSGISFVPNTGLEYKNGTAEAQTIYNTLLDVNLTTPATVGGIPAGTTAGNLTGKTLVGIVDDLLFPTVLPTYTIPTISITSPIGTTQEVGSGLTVALTLSAVKNDAGIFTALNIRKNSISISSSPIVATAASAIASQFGYADPNNPNSGYTLSYTDSLIVPTGSTLYDGIGSYNAGLVKKNNKGSISGQTFALRNVNAPQLAGTGFVSNILTINGYYPYFYGIVTGVTYLSASTVSTIIQSGLGFTKVVGDGGNTSTMNFNAVGAWPWFAIFAPYPNKNIWYENALNSGLIGTNLTDLFSAPTTLAINSPSGYWSSINFKIYVAQKVTTLGTCDIRVS